MSPPPSPAPPLTLITGISGFIGSAVALSLLRHPSTPYHRIRGVVRSPARAAAWTAKYPEYADRVEWAVVEDMGVPGAYREAVKGVEWVVHVASPFYYGYEDNERDMLRPALRGTLELMEAAKASGTVRRVVVTSSFAALQDYNGPNDRPGYTYSEKDWCGLSWEEAKASKDQTLVYVASKAFAEKAAWEFVEKEKPEFSLTTICPGFVLGYSPQPLSSLKDISVSAAWIQAFIDTTELPSTPIPAMVDIADVATAHVEALLRPQAAGQRYLTIGHEFSASQVAHLLADAFPDEKARFPVPTNAPPKPHWGWDVSAVEKDLGIKWKSIKETVQEAARQVLEWD